MGTWLALVVLNGIGVVGNLAIIVWGRPFWLTYVALGMAVGATGFLIARRDIWRDIR